MFQVLREEKCRRRNKLTELLNTLWLNKACLRRSHQEGSYILSRRERDRVIEYFGGIPVQGVHQANTRTKC
jgi:hypothetical protein